MEMTGMSRISYLSTPLRREDIASCTLPIQMSTLRAGERLSSVMAAARRKEQGFPVT